MREAGYSSRIKQKGASWADLCVGLMVDGAKGWQGEAESK